jgi:putative ABC transport system permease protein
MGTIWQDLRYGLRILVNKPGFTIIAVFTLALGIGANTAIFTVVDSALLRGLPYRSPDDLYHLFEKTPQAEFSQREFSYPDYQDYQQNQVFSALAAYTGGGGIITGSGEPERVFAPSASANFFSTLGVEPILGRTFEAGEDKPGTERTTVLTYGFWQRAFGGDPAVLGRTLTVNGISHTVIGVLPKNFQFAFRTADLWLPYQPSEQQLSRRYMHGTQLIGRLQPGITRAQAQAEISAIAARIEGEHNQSHAGTGVIMVPLQEQVVGQVRPILLTLLGAVGFVLLIACANIASLLLTRSIARQKEIAIRSALGAQSRRLVRQLLTESVMLSTAGGAAGLMVASLGLEALVASLPDAQLNALPFLRSLQIDSRILVFATGLSFLTGVVFGLAPALQSTRVDLVAALKEGGRTSALGARQQLRGALVVTEIALAVVLLVGAGLMMKSFLRLLRVDLGFDPHNVLTMTVALPPAKYNEPNRRISFHDQLKERITSLSGVAGASVVNILPLTGGNTTRFIVDGDPVPPPGQEIEANFRVTGSEYFQTLGIPLLSGRFLDERDKPDAPAVVLINKAIADRVFAGRDPVGRKLKYSGIDAEPILIVGVVGDVRISGLDEAIRPVLYYPYQQSPSMITNLVVRTTTDPANLINTIRNECRAVESDVALFNAGTIEGMIDTTPAVFIRRFPAFLIGIFALVALILAIVGIYGVVSYSVSQQSHDIGVRMALGARASDILKMVLKQGLTLVSLGLACGVLGALALTRLLSSLLFEVQPGDPLILVLVSGLLVAVALVACYIPARRATKVDPMVALRYE